MKKLDEERKDGVVKLMLRVDLSQNDYLGMREYVRKTYIEQGEQRIVMDCESVQELPSIAFGVFCSLSRDLQRTGGVFGVVHVSSSIRQIMARTHVDQQVKVFGTWNEAILGLT